MSRLRKHTKKVAIGIVGGIVTLVGVVMIPYPGPGWLVVFAGLAILSNEFEFAAKILDYAKGRYDAWTDWLRQQPLWLRALFFGLTGIVVVLTLWLLNAYGLINSFFNLGLDWVVSPFFR